MGLFGVGAILELFLGFLFLLYLFYKYLTRHYAYWKSKGVAHIEAKLPFSKSTDAEKDRFRKSQITVYTEYSKERYVGMILRTDRYLMIRDLDLIKHVMTKDFSHFVDRKMVPYLPHDFLLQNLFHMEGDAWRAMRSKLSPTFTSGKMKLYFTLIEAVAKQLTDHLEPLAARGDRIEVKDLIARFTTDIIASCAFGLEVNSIRDPDNEIRKIGRLMVHRSRRDFLVGAIYPHIPWLTRIFPLTHTNPVVSKFILKLLTDTIQYRKLNNVVRNDFIDMLMKVKDNTLTVDKDDEDNNFQYMNNDKHKNKDVLTLKEMAAQMSVFFVAGFETASSTTTFLLYELAVNQDIQEKLRKEIDSVIEKNDGKFTYQSLQEMHFLEKCINETLRRYASLPFLGRMCNKSFKDPGSDLVIDKGVRITIPIYSIHHDPEYYPDPYRFDPERFSKEAINSRHPYTFLPFGEGPRICIGKRMGIMQIQFAAVVLLRNYVLKLAPGIPTVLPISPLHILTTSEIPVELLITDRKRIA